MLINQAITALAAELGEVLNDQNATITTAESCTGGAIASAITAVPGCSAWFNLGFVTYSNVAKTQQLQVSTELLNQHGAVSEPVVLAMLQGALFASGATVGLVTSGVAGPTGGSAQKPVGTVCFAWGTALMPRTATCFFEGDRDSIREQAVQEALSRCKEYLIV